MALYLGESKGLKVVIDGISYCINLSPTMPIINKVRLLSADKYILKDSKGIYLTAKESE